MDYISKPKSTKNRVSKEWLKFRKQWLKDNPPAWEYYICGICNKWLHESVVELDHIKKRSTNPELRFDPDNIRPVHKWCNNARD